MMIFNSYFDITRGYNRPIREISPAEMDQNSPPCPLHLFGDGSINWSMYPGTHHIHDCFCIKTSSSSGFHNFQLTIHIHFDLKNLLLLNQPATRHAKASPHLLASSGAPGASSNSMIHNLQNGTEQSMEFQHQLYIPSTSEALEFPGCRKNPNFREQNQVLPCSVRACVLFSFGLAVLPPFAAQRRGNGPFECARIPNKVAGYWLEYFRTMLSI